MAILVTGGAGYIGSVAVDDLRDRGEDVVVVDFTNNAQSIMRAFAKYRQGTPYTPDEPDEQRCVELYQEILAVGVFTQDDAREWALVSETKDDAQMQSVVSQLRQRLTAQITDHEQKRAYVHLLAKFVRSYRFLTNFFSYDYAVKEFAEFAEAVGPQMIKAGTVSDMMKLVRRLLGLLNISGVNDDATAEAAS